MSSLSHSCSILRYMTQEIAEPMIRMVGVEKYFDDFHALKNINLEIPPWTSGCGVGAIGVRKVHPVSDD